MNTATSLATSLAGYRAAAVRLREAAEWNRFDARFQGDPEYGGSAGDHGVLVPLVDASTVKFFMDPDHETQMVDSFAILRGMRSGDQADGEEDRLVPGDHMRTFARITAEFMFLSSPLTIGSDEGRLWYEPPLLAPPHADEVAAMLRRIESKAAKVYQLAANHTEAEVLQVSGPGKSAAAQIAALNDAGPQVGRGQKDIAVVKHLVHGVSASLERLFAPPEERPIAKVNEDRPPDDAMQIAAAIEEAIRWLRLMRQDKLRPLVSHPLCDKEILNPPDDEIRPLAERLAAYKQPSARNRGEPSTRVMSLAWNDATAVVQATKLNDRARQQQDALGKKLRFLLISGDDALHAVYA